MRTMFRTALVLGLLSTPAFAGDAKPTAPAKTDTTKTETKTTEKKTETKPAATK